MPSWVPRIRGVPVHRYVFACLAMAIFVAMLGPSGFWLRGERLSFREHAHAALHGTQVEAKPEPEPEPGAAGDGEEEDLTGVGVEATCLEGEEAAELELTEARLCQLELELELELADLLDLDYS